MGKIIEKSGFLKLNGIIIFEMKMLVSLIRTLKEKNKNQGKSFSRIVSLPIHNCRFTKYEYYE